MQSVRPTCQESQSTMRGWQGEGVRARVQGSGFRVQKRVLNSRSKFRDLLHVRVPFGAVGQAHKGSHCCSLNPEPRTPSLPHFLSALPLNTLKKTPTVFDCSILRPIVTL